MTKQLMIYIVYVLTTKTIEPKKAAIVSDTYENALDQAYKLGALDVEYVDAYHFLTFKKLYAKYIKDSELLDNVDGQFPTETYGDTCRKIVDILTEIAIENGALPINYN